MEQGCEACEVETCRVCRGYLRSDSILRGWAGDEVALADRATIDLDLVALERKFQWPEARALVPEARVVRD